MTVCWVVAMGAAVGLTLQQPLHLSTQSTSFLLKPTKSLKRGTPCPQCVDVLKLGTVGKSLPGSFPTTAALLVHPDLGPGFCHLACSLPLCFALG